MRNIRVGDSRDLPPPARLPRVRRHLTTIDWVASATSLIVVLTLVALVTQADGGATDAREAAAPIGGGAPTAPPVASPSPSVALSLGSGAPRLGVVTTPTPMPAKPATPARTAPPQRPDPRPTPAPTPRAGCPASLQAALDAAPAGSTISVGACTYHATITITKPVTLRGPVVIDGDNSRAWGLVIRASHVTIDGATVRNVKNKVQTGAIDVSGASDVTLEHAHALDSAGACISIDGGSGHRVVDSEMAGCAQEGYHFAGVSDTLVEGNSIHGNNPHGAYDPGWEAGGGKAAGVNGLTFRDNDVYGNVGPGLWCDVSCRNVVITGNRVHNNTWAGILYEISFNAQITDNVVWENGWGDTTWAWGSGILSSTSSGVVISGNIVAWNADGINVIGQVRGSAWNTVRGDYVHGNTIILAPQPGDHGDKIAIGFMQDAPLGGQMFGSSAGNHGAANHLWVSQPEPASCRFQFRGCYSTLASFDGTQGGSGSTYISVASRNSILKAAGIPTVPASH